MRLLRSIVRFALAIVALFGGTVIAARLAAPSLIPGEEVDQAILAAATAVINDTSQRHQVLYLSLDGRDPDRDSLAAIRRTRADLDIKPMSQRTGANDRCTPKEGMVVVGACKKDDFLDVRYAAMPLWGVTLLRASTAACGAEVVMVNILRTWKVASQRWICT